MTRTPIPGVPAPWLPGDDGFLGANSDPATSSGGGVAVANTLYMARLPVRGATLISTLWYIVAVIGVGATSGSFVGLYSPANAGGTSTLLSGSADQGATFAGTTGFKPGVLTTPQYITGGPSAASWPYAAVLCNLATTQVSLERQLNTNFTSGQNPTNVPTMRWGAFAGQAGVLPATLNMTTMAVTAFTYTWLWS